MSYYWRDGETQKKKRSKLIRLTLWTVRLPLRITAWLIRLPRRLWEGSKTLAIFVFAGLSFIGAITVIYVLYIIL